MLTQPVLTGQLTRNCSDKSSKRLMPSWRHAEDTEGAAGRVLSHLGRELGMDSLEEVICKLSLIE